MMHHHDPDLIAAFADGTADDPSIAESLIETCDECRTEFEMQTKVKILLADLPRPEMTDFERSRLHRELWTSVEPVTRPSAGPWWQRVSYVAAAGLLVVGLAGTLGKGLLSGSADSDASGPTLVAAEAAEDTGEAYQGNDYNESPGTTAQASSLTREGAAKVHALDFAAYARLARSTFGSFSDTATTAIGQDSCLEQAEVEDHEILITLAEPFPLWLLARIGSDQDADTPIVFVDPVTCSVIHVED